MFEKNPKWLTQKTDFFNSLNSQDFFCFIPMKISQSFLCCKDGQKCLMIIMFFSQKQQLSEHKQQSVLKCYTVTLHFKKEGMYNKYLKIQHLF